MISCFVCGKIVKETDEYELFGYDGGRIHKKCEPKLDKACESINNMSDSEFTKYMKGERELLDTL